MTPTQASEKVQALSKQIADADIGFILMGSIMDNDAGGFYDVGCLAGDGDKIFPALSRQIEELLNNKQVGLQFAAAILNAMYATRFKEIIDDDLVAKFNALIEATTH